MTVAVKDSTNLPVNLTTQQIANIFSCTAGDGVTIDGTTGKPVIEFNQDLYSQAAPGRSGHPRLLREGHRRHPEQHLHPRHRAELSRK